VQSNVARFVNETPYLIPTESKDTVPEESPMRQVTMGGALLLGGLLATWISHRAGGSSYILAWGPIVYGAHRLITGVWRLNA